MKKFFLTFSVVALFAIGFTASDDDSSNNESASSATQTEQVEQGQEEKLEIKQEEEKLFQPGNSYISNKIAYNGGNSTEQYELNIYKDGTFELKESYRHSDGSGVDYEHEGKWKKNTESRKDIVRTWYTINSDHAKNDFRHGTKILIDEDGRIYHAQGRSEHEAVGGECSGTFRKK